MGSPLTTKLQLNKVMLGEVAGSSIALEVGENLSGVKNNPVKEIYISDFVKKSASDDTQYTANLYATFETNPKFGAIKPIKVKMNVKTDAAGITSRAIASCSAGDGAAVAEVPAGTVGGWCEEERTYTGMQLDKSASTQWPAIYIYNRYDWISNPVCRCDTGWNRKAITSGGGAALRGGHSNVWVNYTCIKD